MSSQRLSSKAKSQLLRRLARNGPATATTLENLIRDRKVPKKFPWQPSWCISRGSEAILVHVLASGDIPPYLERAIEELRKGGYHNAYVLILARDLILETEEDFPPTRQPAAYAASDVAEKAMGLGCALAFEADKVIHLVFDVAYAAPPKCRLFKRETGHIPKWLYGGLATSTDFSPKLQKLIKQFVATYSRATRRDSIPNDREASILLDFAKKFAKADQRFFMPVEHVETLRQFEMSRATHARDHFFHTFNNLFLGFRILGQLFSGRRIIAEVDRFIQGSSSTSNLNPWEVLWFLTCMFHDPAYSAENFWANVRFAFGAEAGAKKDGEMPDEVKKHIRDLWDSQYAAPRKDMHDLYRRLVGRWTPPTVAEKSNDPFDAALQAAYFDGKRASHSLISGLRLINLCQTQKVPRAEIYNQKTALTACVIAALSMMFHDPACRDALSRSGIQPIPFESLPYACVLMFVDCLQDDRRDISVSRFQRHGILTSVEVSREHRTVKALVCLPEVPNSVTGWPGRIAEYESVMKWINAKSETNFAIDYRSMAKLPS